MQVLIDKENMLLLNKMRDPGTLNFLADLECPHVPIIIDYCDSADDFRGLTDLEIKLLIKNAQGPDVAHVFNNNALRRVLFDIVCTMPETVVDRWELVRQLQSLPKGDERRYKYVQGSSVPTCQEGLAEHVGFVYKGDAASTLKRVASIASAPVRTPVAGTANAAVKPPEASDFSMPKVGTNTHTIFSFCHAKWRECGHKEDKATLDNIRKMAVDQLVPQGVNISTVRVQAMRWYQHRHRVAL